MTATSRNCNEKIEFLYLAFELGDRGWKLAFTVGRGQRPRIRTIAANDIDAIKHEIRRAKQRFGLRPDTEIVSCYEAGREGFWLHRCLQSLGIANIVVDSSSIEVNRRSRRAKTDRLDASKLVLMLVRWAEGEQKVWSVVRAPTDDQEDCRQLHRELDTLKRERARHLNRISGLLTAQGVKLQVSEKFLMELEALRRWDGTALPAALRARLKREFERLQFVARQIDDLDEQRIREIREDETAPQNERIRRLMSLRGIAINSACVFVRELFGWREVRNRREVGALFGLTPTPYASGTSEREQGISKTGNGRLRAMAVEIAWLWLRYQPQSELSQWYHRRFGSGNTRMRRIGIVALARKLMVALWKYLDRGEVPAGAELREWQTKLRPRRCKYSMPRAAA
jgi:transposase